MLLSNMEVVLDLSNSQLREHLEYFALQSYVITVPQGQSYKTAIRELTCVQEGACCSVS